jgi:hypothetical protein
MPLLEAQVEDMPRPACILGAVPSAGQRFALSAERVSQ